MSEAIASQLSGGAGRVVDQTWPAPFQFVNNGGTVSQTVTNRLGTSNPQGGSIVYSINANAGFNAQVNGRMGATIGAVAAGAPNGMQWAFHPMVMHFGKLGTGVHVPPPSLFNLDQYGAWRVQMLAFFANPPGDIGAAVDNGLELCLTGGGLIDDGKIMMTGTPGLGFRVYNTDKVEAIMRPSQAGAVTRVDLLTAADGYACGDWHMYEIRCIGANGGTPAIAKFFIDGVLKLTLSWGPGNIMPETNGGYSGFKVYVVTTAGNQNGFAVNQLNFHAARNELNLL